MSEPICKTCPHYHTREGDPSGEERCSHFPGGGAPDIPLRLYPIACVGHPTQKPTQRPA